MLELFTIPQNAATRQTQFIHYPKTNLVTKDSLGYCQNNTSSPQHLDLKPSNSSILTTQVCMMKEKQ